MEEVLLADKYAKALVTCAQEEGIVDQIDIQLASLEAVLARYPQLQKILRSPLVSFQEKERLLETTFKKQWICPELKSFLFLLLKVRRFHLFGQICKIYKDLIYSLRKRLKVFVESAFTLDTEQKDALKRKLARIYHRDIDLSVCSNSKLIGGARVYVGHKLYDGTVERSLVLLRNRMKRD